MKKAGIFIADGCEEVEALTTVDLLRRAGIDIDMLSISGGLEKKGSHGIAFICDRRLEDVNISEYDAIILPGGLPGTTNLGESEAVVGACKDFAKEGKLVAAICAAPTVLGENGLLEGKKAACYPGLEEKLLGADVVFEKVAVDGNIITSRGVGTAIPFALSIVGYLKDSKTADTIAKGIVYGD